MMKGKFLTITYIHSFIHTYTHDDDDVRIERRCIHKGSMNNYMNTTYKYISQLKLIIYIQNNNNDNNKTYLIQALTKSKIVLCVRIKRCYII